MNTGTENFDTTIERILTEQLDERLPFLTVGEVYTLAAILGEQFWGQEGEEGHHALGRVFKEMVTRGPLPFQLYCWTANCHSEYRYLPFDEEVDPEDDFYRIAVDVGLRQEDVPAPDELLVPESGDSPISKEFSNGIYQELIRQVNLDHFMFEQYCEYSLADILGDEFWGEDQTFHRAVGLLFGQLAREGLVPFQRSGTVPFGPTLYTYDLGTSFLQHTT